MRRHIPGLHSGQQDLVSNLDGLFLVRVDRAGHSYQNLDAFAPASEWETLSCTLSNQGEKESSLDAL
jgi:hypothetical protein